MLIPNPPPYGQPQYGPFWTGGDVTSCALPFVEHNVVVGPVCAHSGIAAATGANVIAPATPAVAKTVARQRL